VPLPLRAAHSPTPSGPPSERHSAWRACRSAITSFSLPLELGQSRLLARAGDRLPGGDPLAHDGDDLVVGGRLKSSRPVLATRVGQREGDEDIAAKIGNARSQILASAKLIEDGHPAVAHVPNDRTLRGLVVTLEPSLNPIDIYTLSLFHSFCLRLLLILAQMRGRSEPRPG
jgi:hypothetical protein